jgi:hypothetical protein
VHVVANPKFVGGSVVQAYIPFKLKSQLLTLLPLTHYNTRQIIVHLSILQFFTLSTLITAIES